MARPTEHEPSLAPSLGPLVVVVALIVAAIGLVVATVDRQAPVDYGSDVDPGSVHDPYRAGESLPAGYFQVLPRDAIRPVYEPRFTTADAIGWPDEADVIGVEIGGEARAYPVSFLNAREMVLDEIGGEPLLVSW